MSALHIPRQIKGRQVLPDDLVCFISLDTFGAIVPCGDSPTRIQHEDCVVPYTLHHETPTLFALHEFSLRFVFARDVSTHAIHPRQTTRAVQQGLADRFQYANLATGSNDPLAQSKRLAIGNGSFHGGTYASDVFGMYVGQECFESPGKFDIQSIVDLKHSF